MLKRNTITALALIVLAVIESAVSQNEPTVCDYQKCQDIVKHGVNCSTVAAAIECAQTTILPNHDCSQIVKDEARRKIQEGEAYRRQHCSPPFTVTEPAVSHEPYEPCDYEVCLVYLLEYDLTCSTAAAAIECVQTSVLPNPECSQIVKDQARGNMQEGEEYIRQHCPPLFTDGCCLKVSRMADATTTSDMRMEVEDGRCYYNIRHEVTIHCVAEPAVPPEPTVCHSEFCQLMPDEYDLTCSTVTAAIECVQTIILPNPECSQIAQDEARRKIQEGEEYLRQHCPPPFTDEPVRVARAAVPLCEPERCLDGLNNDGVTCSTVTEAIQCAETTILTNPYCSANVKDVTKDRVWEGLQYLMRNCCAQSSDNTTQCDVARCMDGVNEHGLTCRRLPMAIYVKPCPKLVSSTAVHRVLFLSACRPTVGCRKMGTLLLLVFILDLLASATSKIAPCDVAGCLDNFSLTGDNRQFCVGVRKTLQCVGDITYNYNCSTQDRGQGADIYHRLERMSDCVCSQGSTYTYSLQLSVGLAILAHVLTSFK